MENSERTWENPARVWGKTGEIMWIVLLEKFFIPMEIFFGIPVCCVVFVASFGSIVFAIENGFELGLGCTMDEATGRGEL